MHEHDTDVGELLDMADALIRRAEAVTRGDDEFEAFLDEHPELEELALLDFEAVTITRTWLAINWLDELRAPAVLRGPRARLVDWLDALG